jgi:hypothetical protein
MKFQQDENQFDEWQAYFSYELLRVIKQHLEQAVRRLSAPPTP